MARDLTDVARDAGLPPRDVEQVGEFLFHDEAGLALEELCCALRDEGAAVAPGDLSLIALEGMRALCDPDLWENLPVRPGPQSAPAAPGGFSRVAACPVWGLAELEVLPFRMWTGPCRYALLAGEGLRLDVVLREGDGAVCRVGLQVGSVAWGPPAPPPAPEAPPARARALLASLARGSRPEGPPLRLWLSGDRAVALAGGSGADGAVSLGGACRLLLRAGALVGAEFPGLSAAELAAFARAGVAPSSLDPPGRQPQGFSASLWAPAPSAAAIVGAARAALLALRDGLPARARPALWESPGGAGDGPEAVRWDEAGFCSALLEDGPGGPALRRREATLRSLDGAFLYRLELGGEGVFLDVLPPHSPDPRVDEGAADLLASVLSLAGPALGAEWGYAGSWESSPGPGPALDGRGLPPAAQWASWLSPALLARVGEGRVRALAAREPRASFDGRLLRLGRLALDAYDPADEALRLRVGRELFGR